MKVILSHDVDHLYWGDHLVDTYIPGLMYRSLKQLFRGHIDSSTLVHRFDFTKPLHNLTSLSDQLVAWGIPATFFFGMRKGLNLSYGINKALRHITFLLQSGFEIGLHGMDYENEERMREEKEHLERITGNPVLGIRTHYLRQSATTNITLSKLGYRYNSTDNKLAEPRKVVQSLWSFPISLMDVSMMKSVNLVSEKSLKDFSIRTLDQAKLIGLPYFVLNFHDIYYSKGYPNYYEWFNWIVEYCLSENLEFTTFKKAIGELDML